MRSFMITIALVTQTALAADDFFGLTIGAPLSFAECVRLKLPAVPNYTPPYATVRSPCLKDIRGNMRSGEATGTIAFPIGEGATHSTSGDLLFVAKDGILEAIALTTGGAPVQHAVMRDLRAKLGEPSSMTAMPVVTAAGASLDAISGSWSKPGLVVEFLGVAGSFETGSLVIGTPAAVARLARQERPAAARPL